MDKNRLSSGIEISASDGEGTPASVRQLVEKMGQQSKQSEQELADLKAQQQELLEKINRTALHSSSPPSSEPPSAEQAPENKKTGKKRGGQPGHRGHSRFLDERSDCDFVLNHHPETCSCCLEKFSGEDANPARDQVVEIPPIKPIVGEHRLHQLECFNCGARTRARLAVDVNPSGYGIRGVALVAVLSGLYRHSQSMVQNALVDVVGVSRSLGMVREFIKISEPPGGAQEIGNAVVKQQEKLLELW